MGIPTTRAPSCKPPSACGWAPESDLPNAELETSKVVVYKKTGRWFTGVRRCHSVVLGTIVLFLFGLTFTGCEAPGVPHPLAGSANLAAPLEHEDETPVIPTPTPDVVVPTSVNDAVAPDPAEDPAEDPEIVAENRVELSLKDFVLNPDTLTARAGAITFVLTNEGRYTHDFRVDGNGVDKKAPKVGRGRSREWEITLGPGTYAISCPISNHADRGMVGTLTVAE